MHMKSSLGALAGTLLVSSALLGSAWAQTAAKPLNLTLPPSDILASSSTAPMPPSASPVDNGNSVGVASNSQVSTGKNGTASLGRPSGAATASGAYPAPGEYFGDTSGHLGSDLADTPSCDDSKYNDAQVHGSVSTGVVSGSHIGTGSYSGAAVSVTKAFGDCDHPSGGISISVGGNTNTFNGDRGYRRGY